MVAKVWNYFTQIINSGITKRKCLKCGTLLSTPDDLSTGHLINHLKTRGHEKEWEE